MARLITRLEVHRYAPELNKPHLRNRQTLPSPGITTIQQAKASLFSRWQPGQQLLHPCQEDFFSGLAAFAAELVIGK